MAEGNRKAKAQYGEDAAEGEETSGREPGKGRLRRRRRQRHKRLARMITRKVKAALIGGKQARRRGKRHRRIVLKRAARRSGRLARRVRRLERQLGARESQSSEAA